MTKEPEKGRLHGIAAGYYQRRDPRPPVAVDDSSSRPVWVDEAVKGYFAAWKRRRRSRPKRGAP